MATKKLSKEQEKIIQKVEELLHRSKSPLQQKLFDADLELAIHWPHISERYFGKSYAWLGRKISGYDLDGNVYEITEDEIKTLKNALLDLSKRIETFANTL